MALLDLPTLARERGLKRVSVEMPSLPKTVEKALVKIYLAAIREMTEGVIADIKRAYQEQLSLKDDVTTSINTIDERMVQVLVKFTHRWSEWADDATRLHTRAITRKLRYATNIDLDDVVSPGVVGSGSTVEELLDWNVGLVRSISDDVRRKVSSAVYSGLTARTPVEDVARQISEATSIAKDRARRIASDQTVKLSSALDDQRLRDLGCDGYEWMHSGKLHYRPEHKARDGDFILFGSEIDKTDPPGHAPFCGCKRRMVL